jgi:hypothetical protein
MARNILRIRAHTCLASLLTSMQLLLWHSTTTIPNVLDSGLPRVSHVTCLDPHLSSRASNTSEKGCSKTHYNNEGEQKAAGNPDFACALAKVRSKPYKLTPCSSCLELLRDLGPTYRHNTCITPDLFLHCSCCLGEGQQL